MVHRPLPACIISLVVASVPVQISCGASAGMPLEDFPSVNRIWLCHVKGNLAATKQTPVMANGSGWFRILTPEGASLKKDEVFAVFRPERLELERKSLTLEKSALQSAIEEARLEQQDRHLVLESQKNEAEAELQELNAALTLPKLGKNPEFKKKIDDSITAMRHKIERYEKRIALLQESIENDAEVNQLKLDFQRQQQNFEVMERTAEQRAPFAGSFALTAGLREENKGKTLPFEFWVNSAELIGHVTDDSSYDVTLIDYPSIINRSPLENLQMEVHVDSSSPPLVADFLESRNEGRTGVGARAEKVLIFRIQNSSRDRAQVLAGTTSFGQIFQQLPGDCHIVPKAKLMDALESLPQSSKGGLEAIVRSVWPEAELVAVGHRELAIKTAGSTNKSDRR